MWERSPIWMLPPHPSQAETGEVAAASSTDRTAIRIGRHYTPLSQASARCFILPRAQKSLSLLFKTHNRPRVQAAG